MDYSTKGKDVTITRESPLALYVNRPEGKGVSFMEHVIKWHGVAPTEEELKQATGSF